MSTQQEQKDPVERMLALIEKKSAEFEKALPAHISVKKFVRVVATAIRSNPDLASANQHSFWAACMRSAQDGLIPDGVEAALVIFNTNVGTRDNKRFEKMVQYMPMFEGILKKVRNSGELKSIGAEVVYENDEFDYHIDQDGKSLMHRPLVFGKRGKILGVYAVATMKDGSNYIEVMTLEQVEQIRSSSRAANGGPWKVWWDQMAKKSVIRRLSKILPKSTDMDGFHQSVSADDAFYDLGRETPDETITPPGGEPKPDAPDATVAAMKEAKAKPKQTRKAQTKPVPKPPEEKEPEDDNGARPVRPEGWEEGDRTGDSYEPTAEELAAQGDLI